MRIELCQEAGRASTSLAPTSNSRTTCGFLGLRRSLIRLPEPSRDAVTRLIPAPSVLLVFLINTELKKSKAKQIDTAPLRGLQMISLSWPYDSVPSETVSKGYQS